jgi:hypothetical protein
MAAALIHMRLVSDECKFGRRVRAAEVQGSQAGVILELTALSPGFGGGPWRHVAC